MHSPSHSRDLIREVLGIVGTGVGAQRTAVCIAEIQKSEVGNLNGRKLLAIRWTNLKLKRQFISLFIDAEGDGATVPEIHVSTPPEPPVAEAVATVTVPEFAEIDTEPPCCPCRPAPPVPPVPPMPRPPVPPLEPRAPGPPGANTLPSTTTLPEVDETQTFPPLPPALLSVGRRDLPIHKIETNPPRPCCSRSVKCKCGQRPGH